MKFEKGDQVLLTPGTRVGIDSDEKFEWGGTKYDWYVVGEIDPDGFLGEVVWIIEGVGVSHATMNGGGRDYQLACAASGIKATVRTSFSRDERATFTEA